MKEKETKEGMEGEERKKEELRLTGNERGEGCLELGEKSDKDERKGEESAQRERWERTKRKEQRM